MTENKKGKKKTAAALEVRHRQAKAKMKKIKILIIGIGGGGGTIVSEISKKIDRVNFSAANTDMQALNHIPKKVRGFLFGEDITGGLGTGMNFKLSERLAEKATERIKKLFKNQDICIFVSTLGGGTGSGATPVFVKIANEFPLLSLGIFTLPFRFEGKRKLQIAKSSLEKMKPYLNAYLIIPNERIFQMVDKNTSLRKSLLTLNRILTDNLKEIIDLIFNPGLINIDFADLRTILEDKKKTFFINTVKSSGKDRADKINQSIFSSPLTDYKIKKVDSILFNIAGAGDLKMSEVSKISRAISSLNRNAKIIFGISKDKDLTDKSKIKLTILVVGEEEETKKKGILKRRLKAKKAKKKIKKEEVPAEKIEKSEGEIKEKSSGKGVKNIKKKKEKKEKSKKGKEGKEEKKKKEEEKEKEERETQMGEEKKKTPKEKNRRTALEIKKAISEEEKELLSREKEWEVPAFLRKGLIRKKRVKTFPKNK